MITYDMDARGGAALYEHLYTCIKRDMESGAIAAGQRLPSKRSLARHLGVSVITVETAYAQLVAEGYLEAVERRGFFAKAIEPPRPNAGSHVQRFESAPSCHAGPSGWLEPRVQRLSVAASASAIGAQTSQEQGLVNLSAGSAALGTFPFKTWARCLRRALSQASEESLSLQSGALGSLRLRRAIAAHVASFRGMRVDPSAIVIGAGSQVLYQLVVQLIGRGLRYAIEDPGYPRLAQIYAANDVDLSPVRLEPDGMSLEGLRASGAHVAHVMPSHQFPTGCVTSVAKRHGLLAWAAEGQAGQPRYVIEDDYDCEFRLAGRPIPSLQSIDAAGSVIYINTFAKTLGPGFRMSYLVLPDQLVERFHHRLGFYSCTVSAIDQLALALFMEEGLYERHINRMRASYRALESDLIAALRRQLGPGARFENAEAGLHFVLVLPEPVDDARFAACARERGVAIDPLGAFSLLEGEGFVGDGRSRFLVSFSGLRGEEAPAVAEALGAAYEACRA